MGKAGKTIIKDGKSDYTRVTFKPDLAKFKMTHLTADMEALMVRRAYDLAGCTRGVAVYLNGKKLPVSVLVRLFHSKYQVHVDVCMIHVHIK